MPKKQSEKKNLANGLFENSIFKSTINILVLAIFLHAILQIVCFLWPTSPLSQVFKLSVKETAEKAIFDLELNNEKYRRVVFLSWFDEYNQLNKSMLKNKTTANRWNKLSFDEKLYELYAWQIKRHKDEINLHTNFNEIIKKYSKPDVSGGL